ncbi:pyridoxal kinase [Sphingomonas colocasiae]|uniref:pyridoxal kinase n=1 Tax=Sphingomonas colocasiae TaxID=1848973 RepID=A0ABS7PNV1_9SPHN|nr:pyridoxal kinase [Sphingomonas colocasiae]MBY8822936.1 pyridoxal kinase [Sphingomonas colocasiae]
MVASAGTIILSIQSQVVHGKVGNSAAAPALQAHGLTAVAVPTTLLSNHPHYPTMRGRVLAPDLLADLLVGVEERGLVDAATMLVTGYLGSVENGDVVADFVARAKRRNPALRYVCDPVCGDDDLGGFVAPGLLTLFTRRLLPFADVATPNAWEACSLAGCDDPFDAARLFQAIGPAGIVITGGNRGSGDLQTLVFDRQAVRRIRTPRLPVRPAGSGDLFTACLLAKLARGWSLARAAEDAAAALHAVLLRTDPERWAEMPVEMCLDEIVTPSARFPSTPCV